MHKWQYSLEYIKLKWSFEKDVNLLIWGSASFNCSCSGRPMGAPPVGTAVQGSWEGKLVFTKVYITCKAPKKGRFPPGNGFDR